MPFIVSQLSPNPEPQPGESVCMISLSRDDSTGWRVRASVGENGRDIGRWASECPLAVCQAALLWVAQYPWQVRSPESSMDLNRVFDEVEALAPTQDGVNPMEVFALLALYMLEVRGERTHRVAGLNSSAIW